MKTINIINKKGENFEVLVDDWRYDELMKHKWHITYHKIKGVIRDVYATRSISIGLGKQKCILMHRQILGLTNPKIFGDHINNNTLDNQEHNLRIATVSQNGMNRKPKINSSSKFLGVSITSDKKSWAVYICKDGINKYCGVYKTEIEAALIYNKEAIKLFGDRARLNKFLR